jgi:hypothetical protein
VAAEIDELWPLTTDEANDDELATEDEAPLIRTLEDRRGGVRTTTI